MNLFAQGKALAVPAAPRTPARAGSKHPAMQRTRGSLAVAVMTLGIVFLTRPAHASSILFNDSFADDHVEVTFTGITFINASSSSNCTFSLAASTATCSETSPIAFQGDGPGTFDPLRADNFIEINFLDAVGGPVSDTFFFKKTPTSDPNNPVHVQIIFQSDVEGGPALTPLSDVGAQVFTGVEPPSITLGGCPATNPNCLHPLFVTVVSDVEVTPVPEPASLLLLGTGLLGALGAARRKWLR